MQQLADAAGISQSHLSLIERSRTQPSAEKLVRLARALDVALADLVGPEGRDIGRGQAPDLAAVGLMGGLAPGLAELRDDPTFGGELTDDWLSLLSSLSLRGRRPTTKRDWLALYLLMRPYFADER